MMSEENKSPAWKIGDKAVDVILIDFNLVKKFAEVSGDFNPVHLDEEYAKSTLFGQRIAHGMLISSFFSKVIAVELPGPGSIYLEQNLNFKAPVYLNRNIEIRVEIVEVLIEKNIYRLRTTAVDIETNKLVIEGSATVLKK